MLLTCWILWVWHCFRNLFGSTPAQFWRSSACAKLTLCRNEELKHALVSSRGRNAFSGVRRASIDSIHSYGCGILWVTCLFPLLQVRSLTPVTAQRFKRQPICLAHCGCHSNDLWYFKSLLTWQILWDNSNRTSLAVHEQGEKREQ